MFGDRRRLLLIGAAIAVLILGIRAMQPEADAPSASAATPARGGGRGTAQPAPAVAAVKLDSLTAIRHEPSSRDRNPFRYQPRVVAPPPRPISSTPAVEEVQPPRQAVPAGPPPPPAIPLKFIGLLERANGVKWAVLSDGKVVMHGREGDIVDGRYRIVKIGTESIELTHVDGRGRQVVRLTGQ